MTDCPHPATLTITLKPGWRECVTCGTHIPDREARP